MNATLTSVGALIQVTNPVVLARDLAILRDITPRKTPKDILKCIVLESQDNGIVVASATDLECSIRLELNGVYAEIPGKICVNLDSLTKACKAPKDKALWIKQTENGVQIDSGNSVQTLPQDNVEDFPIIPNMPRVDMFTLGIDTFARMLSRTKHATDVQSLRYALGGVFLERIDVPNDQMQVRFNAVATDGRRLERESTWITEPERGIPGCAVIPPTAIKVLERFGKENRRTASITFRENQAFFQISDRAILVTRVIEGRFPRYQDVFPDSFDTSVDIYQEETRQELVRVLADMARFVKGSDSRGVSIEFGATEAFIRGTRDDGATNSARVKIPYRSGLAVKTYLDPTFLGEALASHDVPFRIEFGVKSPVMIKSDSHDSAIMSMRVDRQDWNPGNPRCEDGIVIEGINTSPRDTNKLAS